MSQLTEHQQQAFHDACRVIDRTRARNIRRLKHWEHGMCGCLNAVRPEVASVTSEENAVIHRLWDTLPGNTCWMSALSMLCNQPAQEDLR
jgi:hypothetical protein